MKVLLVNPLTEKHGINVILPNLGLGYLATSLRREKIEVEILDGCKKGGSEKLIRKMLSKTDYDVVGFQVFTMTLNKTKEYLNLIKSLNNNIITIVGGPHPSGDRENVLDYLPEADFAIMGEGEESLSELLKLLSQNKDQDEFYNVPNLIWRKNGEKLVNSIRYIENLDRLGHPSWDLINPLEYPQAPMGAFVKNSLVAPINVARGCPYLCTFCTANLVMGKKLRSRSKDSIIEEIKILQKNYNIKEIHIIDDNFTLNKDLAMSLCEEIIKQKFKLDLAFPNGVKLSTLDKNILYLLEKAGCYSMAVGIESGSDRILKHMKKQQTVQEIREKVELIKNNTKIRLTGFFIIGYPEETEEDILKTIRLAKELNLARAQFAIYIPLVGSEMYEELKKKGLLKEINYDSIMLHNLCFKPYKISSSKLKFLRIIAYLKFYIRPKILFGILKEIKSFQQLKFILRKIKMLFR